MDAMQIIQWLGEHWPDIVLLVTNAVGIFMYVKNRLEIVHTRNTLHMNFKKREERIVADNTALREKAAAKLSEAKEIAAAAAETVRAEREKMEKEMAAMRAYYEGEMCKYKDSLLEIAQNDKALVANGVAENVTKRFTKKEDSVDANQ